MLLHWRHTAGQTFQKILRASRLDPAIVADFYSQDAPQRIASNPLIFAANPEYLSGVVESHGVDASVAVSIQDSTHPISSHVPLPMKICFGLVCIDVNICAYMRTRIYIYTDINICGGLCVCLCGCGWVWVWVCVCMCICVVLCQYVMCIYLYINTHIFIQNRNLYQKEPNICLFLCIYIYIYICVYINMCIYVHIWYVTFSCVYIYTYKYVYIYSHVFICMIYRIEIYVYKCICIYIYMYMYVYI